MNCVPIDMLPIHSVHCSLLPEQGNPLKFTSLRNIHSCFALRNVFKHRLVWHHILLIYTIHVSRSICTFNGIRLLRTVIMANVHFAGHLRSNRTNIWSDESNIPNVQSRGGTGIENRWFTHSVSPPGHAYQIVHKSQMSAFEVDGAFLLYAHSRLASLRHCMLPRQRMYATNDVRKASVHSNWLWSITEPMPNRPRLHHDAP